MEIRRLKRLSGAAFALTSCTAMLAAVALVPMASAAPTFTYDDADNFQSGGVDDTQTVNLTVTKYRRSDTGNKPWGSVLDAPVDGESKSTPIAGAKFKLYQVNLDGTTNPNGKCGSPADLEVTNEHPGDPTPPVLSCGDLIDPENVAEADREQTTPASGRISWDLGNFGEVKYFVLQETNIPAGVSASKTTLFGLPYATFNTTTDGQGKTTTIAGHIYNVSVFPKDVSTRQFDKSSTGGNKVVQVGDKIPYSIDETIYNKDKEVYPPEASDNTPGDGYLDVSEIGQDSLRIVDRLSSALKLAEGPKVTWSCTKTDGTPSGNIVIPETDYTLNKEATADPGLLTGNLSANPDPNLLFTDGQGGSGTKYVTIDLWNSPTTAETYKTQTFAACKSAINISVSLTAEVTDAGDDTAGILGAVTNSAAVDVYDGEARSKPVDPPSTVSTAAAGFQFAKTDDAKAEDANDTTTKATPVAGAKFRLADPSDDSNTKFLRTDGTFNKDETSTAKFVTAESSALGVVSFTGLPLFTSAQYEGGTLNGTLKSDLDPTGGAVVDAPWTSQNGGKLNLVEYEAPDPYATPSGTYGSVTFAISGKKASELANLGTVPPTTPIDGASFGTYQSDAAAIKNAADAVDVKKPFTTAGADGNRITLNVGMINYTPDKAPIGLPLTGGKGIVVFLILGAAVMGVTLYVNHRRNKANVTA